MKSKITQEQYQQVKDQSNAASMVLENEDFKFIPNFIDNNIDILTKQILTGINSETNIHLTDIQTKELQAQYRVLKEFSDYLKYFSSKFKNLQKDIEEKKVFMEGQDGPDIVSERA